MPAAPKPKTVQELLDSVNSFGQVKHTRGFWPFRSTFQFEGLFKERDGLLILEQVTNYDAGNGVLAALSRWFTRTFLDRDIELKRTWLDYQHAKAELTKMNSQGYSDTVVALSKLAMHLENALVGFFKDLCAELKNAAEALKPKPSKPPQTQQLHANLDPSLVARNFGGTLSLPSSHTAALNTGSEKKSSSTQQRTDAKPQVPSKRTGSSSGPLNFVSGSVLFASELHEQQRASARTRVAKALRHGGATTSTPGLRKSSQ